MTGYIEHLRARVGPRPVLLAFASVVLFDAQERVLLQQRGDNGRWGLPGGYFVL